MSQTPKKRPTCLKCNLPLKGHMGKKKDICPTEHGHYLTANNRFTCCNEGCDSTFTSLFSADKHSTSSSCKYFQGEEIRTPCPNSCGKFFTGSQAVGNSNVHANSTMCPNHPLRTSTHRTTISHAVVNNTKYCNCCKDYKSLDEFAEKKNAKNDTKLDYLCFKCRSLHAMRQGCIVRARKEGNDHTLITLDYIRSLMVESCPVFNVPLQYGSNTFSKNSATVDAMSHEKGHVVGNLKIISSFANTIKNNSTVDEMIQLHSVLERKMNCTLTSMPDIIPCRNSMKQCRLCALQKEPSEFKSESVHTCHKCKSVISTYKNMKIRAKEKELLCDITRQQLIDLSKTSCVCPIFGTPLKFGNEEKICDQSASVDRVDSTKGYTLSNIWWISYKANRMKSDASLHDISLVLKYMQSVC